MQLTTYFRTRVLARRPYIRPELCECAITEPEHAAVPDDKVQDDGRIRHWIYIDELGRYLRVITLADGVTLHNAFPDRSFLPPESSHAR